MPPNRVMGKTSPLKIDLPSSMAGKKLSYIIGLSADKFARRPSKNGRTTLTVCLEAGNSIHATCGLNHTCGNTRICATSKTTQISSLVLRSIYFIQKYSKYVSSTFLFSLFSFIHCFGFHHFFNTVVFMMFFFIIFFFNKFVFIMFSLLSSSIHSSSLN